jgi:hypothetical protein
VLILNYLAVNAAAAALVAWNTLRISPSVISVARAAGGGELVRRRAGHRPGAERNPGCGARHSWRRRGRVNGGSGGAQTWKAAGFDAAGPQIDTFAAPGIVSQGEPANFIASAHDLWSPFGLSWSFGDGTAANGGAVSHTFARPGRFPFTVTATDAVGNSSTSSASVIVRDTTRPRISRLTMSHRRFRVGRKATAGRPRAGAAPMCRSQRRFASRSPRPVVRLPDRPPDRGPPRGTGVPASCAACLRAADKSASLYCFVRND